MCFYHLWGKPTGFLQFQFIQASVAAFDFIIMLNVSKFAARKRRHYRAHTRTRRVMKVKSCNSRSSMAMKRRKLQRRVGPVCNRNHVCAACGKRSGICFCASAPPCVGILSLARFRSLISFLGNGAGQQRRFFADCFDLRLLARWMLQLAQRKASGSMLLFAVVAFKYFNRVGAYRVIGPCVSPKTVAWDKMLQRMDC